MIVKIKNETGDYCYFEADSVMQSRLKMSLKDLQDICNPDTIFMITNPPEPKDGIEISCTRLNLYKKRKSVQWIITNHVCYLMNEDGRTIDKI